ncbi:hypothetical protein SDJN02_17720, partial [Cucurbita argyrosperma subsp. argyrosperma]
MKNTKNTKNKASRCEEHAENAMIPLLLLLEARFQSACFIVRLMDISESSGGRPRLYANR